MGYSHESRLSEGLNFSYDTAAVNTADMAYSIHGVGRPRL